jgi:hypothetical protein
VKIDDEHSNSRIAKGNFVSDNKQCHMFPKTELSVCLSVNVTQNVEVGSTYSFDIEKQRKSIMILLLKLTLWQQSRKLAHHLESVWN